jgi:hypothetical protein
VVIVFVNRAVVGQVVIGRVVIGVIVRVIINVIIAVVINVVVDIIIDIIVDVIVYIVVEIVIDIIVYVVVLVVVDIVVRGVVVRRRQALVGFLAGIARRARVARMLARGFIADVRAGAKQPVVARSAVVRRPRHRRLIDQTNLARVLGIHPLVGEALIVDKTRVAGEGVFGDKNMQRNKKRQTKSTWR